MIFIKKTNKFLFENEFSKLKLIFFQIFGQKVAFLTKKKFFRPKLDDLFRILVKTWQFLVELSFLCPNLIHFLYFWSKFVNIFSFQAKIG